MRQLDDVTDRGAILFPNNHNQQHAAARILIELKAADDLVPNMAYIEAQVYAARSSGPGPSPPVSDSSSGSAGCTPATAAAKAGRRSTRFSAALRRLADFTEQWAQRREPDKVMRDDAMANLLGNSRYGIRSTAPLSSERE